MLRVDWKPTVCLIAVVFACTSPLLAGETSYNETGTVLSTVSKHGHFYQVETESKVFLMLCATTHVFHFGAAECKNGDKPIAAKDTLHFRVDGDWAYVPISPAGSEDKLQILTTELKVVPPLPADTDKSGAATAPGHEAGVVIGTGMHIKGQHGVGWSTNPAAVPGMTTASGATPVMSAGPVTAIPVTGGPPVIVMPTAPTTGGVITGVPVTGGAPITAIPTAPVAGTPVGGAPGGVMMGGGGAPAWLHILRIQAKGRTYLVECSGKQCKAGNKPVLLGDTLTFRTDKKSIYLTDEAGAEQKYKILETTTN